MLLDDIEEIFSVRVKIWLKVYPSESYGVRRENLIEKFSHREKYLKKLREKINSHGKTRQGWVVLIQDRIVGFAEVFIEDEITNLETIYVLPEYQGMGIGKALLHKAFEFSQGRSIDKMVVKVVGYNKNAIAFYEKMGFNLIGDSGEHVLIKEKGIKVPSTVMQRDISCT